MLSCFKLLERFQKPIKIGLSTTQSVLNEQSDSANVTRFLLTLNLALEADELMWKIAQDAAKVWSMSKPLYLSVIVASEAPRPPRQTDTHANAETWHCQLAKMNSKNKQNVRKATV